MEKIQLSQKSFIRFLLRLFFIQMFSWAAWGNPGRLVILGDSLTEGLGVAKENTFSSLLEKKIKASGKSWEVINSGISGATSASGPSRMKWNLKAKPQMVIIALGANDGLRGLPIESTEKNLEATIQIAQKEKITVIIAGMLLPPNYGAKYSEQFKNLYEKIAKKYSLKKIPFLLEGVAGNSAMNQDDGIHPNEKGHEKIAETVYQSIKGLL